MRLLMTLYGVFGGALALALIILAAILIDKFGGGYV
jgi:hypothetical protein